MRPSPNYAIHYSVHYHKIRTFNILRRALYKLCIYIAYAIDRRFANSIRLGRN